MKVDLSKLLTKMWKVHFLNIALTAGFLFLLSIVGVASVAPLSWLGSGWMARVGGLFLSGAVLYALVIIIQSLAVRIGCVFTFATWFVLPLSSLAIMWLGVGGLFSFAVSIFWQVILGFALIAALAANTQYFTKMFAETPEAPADTH